jgi:CRP-like cAMP-binding protein
MRTELLDGLSDADRTRLLDRAVPRHLELGEILHIAGDKPDRVHLVDAGLIKLSVRNSEGDETILALAPPGTVVGDLAVIDGGPQPLDAVAAIRSVVTGFDGRLFVELMTGNPRSARDLARMQAARTRWIAETALERTAGEVSARLAGRLLDLGRMLAPHHTDVIEFELPVGQRDLGKLAGVCRESTNKTLRRLKAAGVLDYQGRKLRILRPDTLRMMRCGNGM